MNTEGKKATNVTNLAVLALLVAILVGILLVYPQISKIKTLSATVNQKESELNEGLMEVSEIKEFALLLKSAKSDIEKLGVAIPEEERADEALLQMAVAAGSAGINITGVGVDAQGAQSSQEAEGGSGSVTLTVSTTGEYGKTIDFIKKAEKNLRPVSFRNITLSSDDESSGEIAGSFMIDFPFINAIQSGSEEVMDEQ
ncbi:MAG: hypothetical protein BWY43_00414 [candidate division WS2 bacterium ADurb.Bin280]|uniref:Pilus assembly protein, PilO n=1 Tax=candidate division WS2 bacterium ADurb.Bin280 TaxID=1852829 RepID=A0A1V5SDR6_9BACT|nr:MAG: hypothetical protein BWY43_00414 [candidate division WS2 bacterium ADurb.Bin280]